MQTLPKPRPLPLPRNPGHWHQQHQKKPRSAGDAQPSHKWCQGKDTELPPTSALSRPGEGSRCQQASLGPPTHSEQVITKMGDEPVSPHCNYPRSPCQIQVNRLVSPIAFLSEKKKAATSWTVRMLYAGPDMTGVKEQNRYQTRQEMHPLLCTVPRDKVTVDNDMQPTFLMSYPSWHLEMLSQKLHQQYVALFKPPAFLQATLSLITKQPPSVMGLHLSTAHSHLISWVCHFSWAFQGEGG